jgi:hypothetical protein
MHPSEVMFSEAPNLLIHPLKKASHLQRLEAQPQPAPRGPAHHYKEMSLAAYEQEHVLILLQPEWARIECIERS